MKSVEEKIIDLIRQHGPLTFEQFMRTALYDRDGGYYMAEEAVIGREGDYYTSSHLHPVFGILIGRQIEEMWEALGRPADFALIEAGPGEGYLCHDMLGSLRERPVYGSLRCLLVEISPEREARQRRRLEPYMDRLSWVHDLSAVGPVTGCILSNELIDALPVHLVQMAGGLREVYVDFDERAFREVLGPPSTPDIAAYFQELGISLEDGYRTEVNLAARDWLETAAGVLGEGFVLTIDYGYTAREYYAEDRTRGTLLCYYRHQVHENPLIHVGRQDITAHVNFSSMKIWGEQCGFRTVGFCGQGAFLTAVGLEDEVRRLAASSDDFLFEIARIKTLILPQGMGESHSVLVQYRGDKPLKLKGFKLRNRVRFL